MATNVRIPQPEGLNTFFKWWHYELMQIVPFWIRRKFTSKPNRIAITPTEGQYILSYPADKSGACKTQAYGDSEELKKDIEKLRKKSRYTYGLRLKSGQYFKRSIELPATARFKIDQILDLDLERSTPFNRNQIYADYIIESEYDGKLLVSQYIVKKPIVDELIGKIDGLKLDIQFIDAESSSVEQETLPVNFSPLKQPESAQYYQPTLNHMLVFLSVILFAFITQQAFNRQADALEVLNNKLTVAKKKAQAVRTQLNSANKQRELYFSLNREKQHKYTLLDIWKEVTDKLPDTAWITKLTINDHKLQITGYALNAERLISILDKSVLFEGVKFLSPVTMDQRHKRERFIIQCIVKERTSQHFASKEKS